MARTQRRRSTPEGRLRGVLRNPTVRPPRTVSDDLELLMQEIADHQATVVEGLGEAMDDDLIDDLDYPRWLDWVGDGTKAHRGFDPTTQDREFKQMLERNEDFLTEYGIYEDARALRKKTVVLFGVRAIVNGFSV